MAHLKVWKEERRERLQREREKAERIVRAQAEVEFAEARRRRLEEVNEDISRTFTFHVIATFQIFLIRNIYF